MVARYAVNTLKEVETSLSRFEQNGIPVKGVILNSTSAAPARIRIMAITNTNISRMRNNDACIAPPRRPDKAFTPHPASKPAHKPGEQPMKTIR